MRKHLVFSFLFGTVALISSACSSQVPDGMEIQGVPPASTIQTVSTFDECVAAGFPVLRSLPPQCVSSEGKTFIADGSHVEQVRPIEIGNFDECVAAGNVIRKTLPASCMTADGRIFSDSKGAAPDSSFKVVEAPALDKSKSCKNQCGDGECQEMVCMALGCPCAETSQSCPIDCK